KRDAAAGQDAFLDRGARRMHRVVDAILALLDLDLSGPADPDHRNAAGELGQPLLQLLAIVVGRGLLDLRLDLRNARLDVGLLAAAVDDRGVLLVDHHLLGFAKHGQRDVLELDAATFNPPRSLLTTSVAKASPSTSSATINSGLPVCTTASSSGNSSLSADSF